MIFLASDLHHWTSLFSPEVHPGAGEASSTLEQAQHTQQRAMVRPGQTAGCE